MSFKRPAFERHLAFEEPTAERFAGEPFSIGFKNCGLRVSSEWSAYLPRNSDNINPDYLPPMVNGLELDQLRLIFNS